MNNSGIDVFDLEKRIRLLEKELNCRNLEKRIEILENELTHIKSAIQYQMKKKKN